MLPLFYPMCQYKYQLFQEVPFFIIDYKKYILAIFNGITDKFIDFLISKRNFTSYTVYIEAVLERNTPNSYYRSYTPF